jgi:3-isopropylmalate/(R)-2-methylmalate dehydratase small subunit
MNELITGPAWVLTDAQGALINDIDTDMIFHNRYLHITDMAQMGQFALDNLAGWKDFAKRVAPGAIVIAGSNFGCGSSRQGAVDCFRSLGVAALIAQSFGAIYFRNAVNTGWPALACPALTPADVATGDAVELSLDSGVWRNVTRNAELPKLKAVSRVQREIMAAGGLFALQPGG